MAFPQGLVVEFSGAAGEAEYAGVDLGVGGDDVFSEFRGVFGGVAAVVAFVGWFGLSGSSDGGGSGTLVARVGG